MESNHIMSACRYIVLVIAQLFVFSWVLSCGCGRQTSSTEQVSSADYNPQKERIERIIGVELPESAGNCRYDSKDYGMGNGIGWGYFEISNADLPGLLDATNNLPDAAELGQDPVARENIERAMQQAGVSITWWKPLTLRKRQYAEKIIGSEKVTGNMGILMLPQIDICVGEIRDDLMGVYLVYHCG